MHVQPLVVPNELRCRATCRHHASDTRHSLPCYSFNSQNHANFMVENNSQTGAVLGTNCGLTRRTLVYGKDGLRQSIAG